MRPSPRCSATPPTSARSRRGVPLSRCTSLTMTGSRMSRLHAVLAALREGPGYVSGDAIATRLEISRTAVWKYVKQLEGLGYRLEKVKGKGYQLTVTPDRLY